MTATHGAGADGADSVGGAVHEPDAAVASGLKSPDEPVLAQNTTSTEEKIDGIVAQTREDLRDDSDERYQEVLRQRLSEAGIEMTDDDVRSLAQRSAPGGSGGSGI